MNVWEERYASTAPSERSWTEEYPATSIEMIDRLGLTTTDPIIDVGGGSSRLVDVLTARRFTDLTVLDRAPHALAEARKRLLLADGDGTVEWVVADVTTWVPRRSYRLWHDRAVFHFLTREADRRAYRHSLNAATSLDSLVIVATFAPDGPTECSGLPVSRWSVQELVDEMSPDFDFLEGFESVHVTPWGVRQPFTWTAFRRRA